MRQRSSQILSIENLIARNLGVRASCKQVKAFEPEHIDALELLEEQKQALKANLAVMSCIDKQVDQLERRVVANVKLREDYKALKTVSGVGVVLAVTIALETGDIGRFASPGNFASYARMVNSRRESNGKRRAKATRNAATSTWPGPSSRQHILPFASTRRSSAGIRRSAQAACPSWPSRRWHTSWRVPATTS